MTNYSQYVGVRRRRPLIDEHTPLGDVPVEWLQNVEPKIARKGFKGCWISYAYTDKEGRPQIKMKNRKGKRVDRALARYVMSIFFEFPQGYYIRRTCPYQQCVNPNHLYISSHWRQE
jgi:hypothetical protein